ncbi:MAG: hypothetical protein WAQ08_01075 [Aquabacterium sp.]|jgi:hypothetical protein|uniref:hypothetical protein n=1 Tax=Aquabacterium sp. TaxID=1872578 RepID=UPI003BAE4E05
MKLQLFSFTCAECGSVFTAFDTPEDGYGDFLVRSHVAASEARLLALIDPVYAEVRSLIAANPRTAPKKAGLQAHALQQIYGEVACDPDRQGHAFGLDVQPICPQCASQRMASWEPVAPVQTLDKDVPPITYRRWMGLSLSQKQQAVDEALRHHGWSSSSGVMLP